MKIEVYTDGSATVATKPGGWGYVIVLDGIKHHEGSGGMERATNNDAELQAAVEGLKHVLLMRVQDPAKYGQAEVTLVSDSEIVLGWTNGNYRFKQKAKMATFEILKTLAARLRVQTRWVEGHTGDEHNERCDELANIARKKLVAEALGETNKALGAMVDGLMKLPAKPKKTSRDFAWDKPVILEINGATTTMTIKDVVKNPSNLEVPTVLFAVCSVLSELIDIQEKRRK